MTPNSRLLIIEMVLPTGKMLDMTEPDPSGCTKWTTPGLSVLG
jgi:hypothetical protein